MTEFKRNIYNPDIKNEYLNTKPSNTATTICSIFSRSFSFEELLKKDLYDFNYNEYITLFEKCSYTLAGKVSNVKSLIKDYVMWATSKGYCSGSSIVEIERVRYVDITGYYMTISKYFKNLDELLDCIKTVYTINQCDVTAYEPLQLFYGLCWYGLKDEEIYNLKPQNILGTELNMGSNKISISDRMADIANRVSKQEYTIGVDEKKRVYADSPYLFKSIVKSKANCPIDANFHATKNRLWRKLMKNVPITNKFYGKVLSTVSISRCGLFYMLHELECAGTEITPGMMKEILRDRQITTETLDTLATNRIADYKKWKSYCEFEN